jgi:hypothetical protein
MHCLYHCIQHVKFIKEQFNFGSLGVEGHDMVISFGILGSLRPAPMAHQPKVVLPLVDCCFNVLLCQA